MCSIVFDVGREYSLEELSGLMCQLAAFCHNWEYKFCMRGHRAEHPEHYPPGQDTSPLSTAFYALAEEAESTADALKDHLEIIERDERAEAAYRNSPEGIARDRADFINKCEREDAVA